MATSTSQPVTAVPSYGAVYQVTPAGQAQVLHSFSFGDFDGFLAAPLLEGKDGNFYGLKGPGQHEKCGVFQLTPAGTVHILATFGYNQTTFVLSGGANPLGGLIQGRDGNFYGTTQLGGLNNDGIVYSLTASGTTSDGNFYITSGGEILKITRAGVSTVLHTFTGGAEARTSLGLIEGKPGVFYGTTAGTIFKLTSTGVFTTLHTFASALYLPGYTRNGGTAYAGLTLGRDGNFYGTTDTTVFVITPEGAFTTLNAFAFSVGVPNSPLFEGSDGNFYGSAYQANSGELGAAQTTIFQITPGGALNNLYTFPAREGANYGASGQPPDVIHGYPRGYNAPALAQGPDGNIYGLLGGNYTTNGFPTAADLPETYGAVFRIPLASVANSPLLTSAGPPEGVFGQPYSYQTTANQAVSSYSTSSLPKGLSLNTATGLISGVPVYVPATYDDGEPNPYGGDLVTVTAQTAAGPATETFVLNLVLPVTVTTTTPQVTLGSGRVGKFTLRVPGLLSPASLQVNYNISGTAINGVDYQRLTGKATFGGNRYVKFENIEIIPQGDLGGAAKKTVKLTLEPGPGYVVGTKEPVKIELLNPGQ